MRTLRSDGLLLRTIEPMSRTALFTAQGVLARIAARRRIARTVMAANPDRETAAKALIEALSGDFGLGFGAGRTTSIMRQAKIDLLPDGFDADRPGVAIAVPTAGAKTAEKAIAMVAPDLMSACWTLWSAVNRETGLPDTLLIINMDLSAIVGRITNVDENGFLLRLSGLPVALNSHAAVIAGKSEEDPWAFFASMSDATAALAAEADPARDKPRTPIFLTRFQLKGRERTNFNAWLASARRGVFTHAPRNDRARLLKQLMLEARARADRIDEEAPIRHPLEAQRLKECGSWPRSAPWSDRYKVSHPDANALATAIHLGVDGLRLVAWSDGENARSDGEHAHFTLNLFEARVETCPKTGLPALALVGVFTDAAGEQVKGLLGVKALSALHAAMAPTIARASIDHPEWRGVGYSKTGPVPIVLGRSTPKGASAHERARARMAAVRAIMLRETHVSESGAGGRQATRLRLDGADDRPDRPQT